MPDTPPVAAPENPATPAPAGAPVVDACTMNCDFELSGAEQMLTAIHFL